MKNTNIYIQASIKMIFLVVALGSVTLLTFPYAKNFQITLFKDRCVISMAYFGLAAILGMAYSLQWHRSYSHTKVIAGSFVMLLMADLVCSYVRHDIILIVFPALFVMPGGIFGATFRKLCKQEHLLKKI